MTIHPLTLDDKYAVERGRVFLTGIQALVRLPMMQKRLDRAAGLNTAGFISGYRGSPLGGLDQQLWRAKHFLDAHDLKFQPGVNEDLAVTAVWGTQQVNLYPGARFDGVFGMWYGKAPGVDRSGDAFRHANAAGTWGKGGVLAIAGDDHACKSSTLPSQSEFAFMDWEIPILSPSGIQEVLDYGLIGWALSRYAGVWVSMIALAETMDASATVDVAPDRLQIRTPRDVQMPQGGFGIRLGDTPQDQERRLREFRVPAVRAFSRENVLNRVVLDSPNARVGIVTTGKAYADFRQALIDLGLDNHEIARLGLRVLKVGMPWPLDYEPVRRFAEGLETILVIEEKRDFVETQVRSAIYDMPDSGRPRVEGKFDHEGRPLLRSILDLTPSMIAKALSRFFPREQWSPQMAAHLALIEAKNRETQGLSIIHERQPYYCSGCPHNTSTKVPEGSRALAGIGCHYMVTRMDRRTDLFTQMGGEGVPWIGTAPFTDERHIFANLGDGTYFHSGLLAIRQAVAAKVNITYKLLYNDAVAMTGGQHVDGELPVDVLARQIAAEGVAKLVVVSDDPDKYPGAQFFPHGTKVEHRDRLDAIQRELREHDGVTVIIYDQTCAAEKRRRRKRGLMIDPPKRVFINDLVCEGCGDCSVKSNCLSVEPLETEFGRKREINQSSCNKDYSCINGFCPSFVTIEGDVRLRSRATNGGESPIDVPEPALPALAGDGYNIVITGIGGTGVTSIGAILGTAAHIEGSSATVLDMMGLAQKGGGVTSYVRIAPSKGRIHGPRVTSLGADLILACDMVVAAKPETIDTAHLQRTRAVVNGALVPTAGFIRDAAIAYDVAGMIARLRKASKSCASVDADELAVRLLGDQIYANMLLTGFAYQQGLIPISSEAILRAIELNGAEVKKNKRAFALGRLAAHDEMAARRLAGLEADVMRPFARSLAELIARRSDFLAAYQNRAYAQKFETLIAHLRKAEEQRVPGRTGLAEAAAKSLFKLMAYKDEYEVARLYTDGSFERKIAENFAGNFKIKYHLAPPVLAQADPDTGIPKKVAFGPWMKWGFHLLASLKRLRGTPLDIFGYTQERRLERQMIEDYEALLRDIAANLKPENHAHAVRLASAAQEVKGFGHVKLANYKKMKENETALKAAFATPPERIAAE
ncbi:MAG: indolepyruvate ferredoxin oxidoreductase family protein [Alphaproteobacteria bacterium]|nr:indolepyruvate ferredoxin oxidoreductase family protein [Alphaproteobacteria bacterium]